MNIKRLREEIGREYRMRPLPLRIDTNGGTLPEMDDRWRLDAVLERPTRLRLVNVSTGHVAELEPDNVREYRSPDFLVLRCQLSLRADGVQIEPIIGNRLTEDEVFIRLEAQIPHLLSEMRRDLAERPLAREFVIMKRAWTYWAKGNELVYYFDDHANLRDMLYILANHDLVEEITYNNTERFLISERLAAYLCG